MSTIKLNDDVSIDLAKLIESRMVILANSGGGKSWAIRRIAEEAVGKVQVIIIDPEGEFASLREKFDFILAGKNADVPVEVRSASLLATKLLALNKSAVIDLYELHPQERQRYVKLFCDGLVNCPKNLYHPVIIILDEAHDYVPEGKPSEATYSVEALASKGRKRGQCLIPASQRVSKLSKNVSAECNNKLVGRASQDIDMKRAGDELGFAKDRLVELRQLKPGEFFAFGPAISDDVLRVKIGDVQTTHAKVGYKKNLKTPPPSAVIKRVLGELADLPQEAAKELENTKELKGALSVARREITRLQREVEMAAPRLSEPELRALVRPVLDKMKEWQAYAASLERMLDGLANTIHPYHLMQQPSDIPTNVLIKELKVKSRSPLVVTQSASAGVRPAREHKIPRHKDAPADTTAALPADAHTLNIPERKVLDAIAWFESIGVQAPRKIAVAFLAGYSGSSGGYNNLCGMLRTKGLIDYPLAGTLQLTEHGHAEAQTPVEALTQEELHRKVLSVLATPEGRVLQPLLNIYPQDMSAQELAEAAGYQPTSGGFNNLKGRLRSLGLADYPSPNRIKAADLLFI